MTPRAGRPARASSWAGRLSEARRAFMDTRADDDDITVSALGTRRTGPQVPPSESFMQKYRKLRPRWPPPRSQTQGEPLPLPEQQPDPALGDLVRVVAEPQA